METSEDILRQIENATRGLPEGEEEAPQDFKQEADSSTIPDDPVYTYLEQKTEREALVDRWKTEEPQRIQEEYERTGVIPPYRPFEQWVQEQAEPVPQREEMQRAMAEDINDLYDRYGEATHGFFKRLRQGELEIPDELFTEDNAFEQFFISNITEEEARRMTPEQLQRVIEGANMEPLRTRSLDIAIQGRKRPMARGGKR